MLELEKSWKTAAKAHIQTDTNWGETGRHSLSQLAFLLRGADCPGAFEV